RKISGGAELWIEPNDEATRGRSAPPCKRGIPQVGSERGARAGTVERVTQLGQSEVRLERGGGVSPGALGPREETDEQRERKAHPHLSSLAPTAPRGIHNARGSVRRPR